MKINLKKTIGTMSVVAGSTFAASTNASADVTTDSTIDVNDSQVQELDVVANNAEVVLASNSTDAAAYNQAIIDAVNLERAKYGLPAIQQSSNSLQNYADQRDSLDGNTIIAQHSNNDQYMANVYYGAQDYSNAQGAGAETLMLAVTGATPEEVAANFIASVYATDANGSWNNAHVNMMLNSNIADAAFAVRPDATYGMGYQIVALYILNDDTSNAGSATQVDQAAESQDADHLTIVMPESQDASQYPSNNLDANYGLSNLDPTGADKDTQSTNTTNYEQFTPNVMSSIVLSNLVNTRAVDAQVVASNAEAIPLEETQSETVNDNARDTNQTVTTPTLPNTGEADQSGLEIAGFGLTAAIASLIAARRRK